MNRVGIASPFFPLFLKFCISQRITILAFLDFSEKDAKISVNIILPQRE